jgi:RNA polymerase sigma factor (sigma-70 family)
VTVTRHIPRRGVDVEYSALSDAALIVRTQQGDPGAYGELWIRHERVALALARTLSTSNGDELVAEAFAKILRTLHSGRGPTDNFRAYLFTTIRSCAVDDYRRSSRSVAVGHSSDLEEMTGKGRDPNDDNGEKVEHAQRAWNTLAKREQLLMWASAVQGYSTAEIAEHLGLKPATAAVWIHRARARLRAAFLTGHVERSDDPTCQRHRDRFVPYLRDTLTAARRQTLVRHLDSCIDCKRALAIVSDVNTRMRSIVWPLL